MSLFTINSANESDVPILLAMIRELAEFERLDHTLEITRSSLRSALFGPLPVAAALLARVGNEVVGYAVYYRTFSTFVGQPGIFLDDLYVRPPFRKQGIGHALLGEVARIGTQLGNGRFEWIALRWNENAFRFYRQIGAEVMDDWAYLRMRCDEVKVPVTRLMGGTS